MYENSIQKIEEKYEDYSYSTQNNSSSESHLTNVILDLVKQNQEFKDLIVEQNKQMMEMVKEGKIINNTTNNNKFNLNIFLNEKCKDAMNIMDFANSLDIKLKELEDVGTLGYATGISNIIVRGLNELDIYKRPIHCSDLKRESMHVKDQNMWILDKEKTLLETAIKRVARKNILKVQDWKQANPEYAEINSKTMDKYGQILIEATGSFEADEKERDMNKIIRNIAKEVIIEKL
jgi:ribosomal protein S9